MSTHVVDIKVNTYYTVNNGKLIFVYKKDENIIYTVNKDGIFEDFDITGRIFLSWNKFTNYSKEQIVDSIEKLLNKWNGVSTTHYTNRLKECYTILTGKTTETNSKYKYLLII